MRQRKHVSARSPRLVFPLSATLLALIVDACATSHPTSSFDTISSASSSKGASSSMGSVSIAGNSVAFGDGGCLACGTDVDAAGLDATGSASSGVLTQPNSKVAGMMYADFSAAPILDDSNAGAADAGADGGAAADAGAGSGAGAEAGLSLEGGAGAEAGADGGSATDAATATATDAGAAAPIPVPSNAAALFGAPTQGAPTGGPCLVEPEINSLYPDNWLRPRFRWVATPGENVFELRLVVANQTNPLVVYTTSNEWTMPLDMWNALRADSYDEMMTVSVRGGTFSGGALTNEAIGSAGPIGIAPVNAPGTVVYWTPTNGTALKGFAIGDETVTPVLQPSQVAEYTTTCIGCHNATPDGDYASFGSSYEGWANGFANIQPNQTGAVPPWLGAAGRAVVEKGALGIHTLSGAHWTTGDRIEITAYNPKDNAASELAWIDLEATAAPASGILQRTGDTNYAGAPSWSHNGTQIAYVSTNANVDGRLGDGDAGIYVIPYANRTGGVATPLAGANDLARNYYPTWSPDDQLIAFDKTATGTMYNSPGAEVYVVPAPNNSDGGTVTPTRLAANDPPACTGSVSPGVTNSWPKWAPAISTVADGRTFYWLVFSSTRDPWSGGGPQLYLTALVIDASGHWTTYGALYFWNQPETEHNHTPAWDYFQIPPPPPPPVIIPH